MSELKWDYSRLQGTVFSKDRVRNLKVLVVGAGALGNEILKNLCLLGVGHLCVVDRDHVEASNLTRSVLFATPTIAESIVSKEPKATLVVKRIREINPDIDATGFVGEIADFGLGRIRQFDLVFSALDNEMARLELSWACSITGRLLVDGGLGNHNYSSGLVTLFPGGSGPCYACRKTSSKRSALLSDLLGFEAPCGERERLADEAGFVSTTPVMASVIGAIQVEMGLRHCLGGGQEELARCIHISLHPEQRLDTFTVQRNPNCPLHEAASSYYVWRNGDSRSTRVLDLIEFVEKMEKGSATTFTFRWPIVSEAVCLECENSWSPMVRAGRFRRYSVCDRCGSEKIKEKELLTELTRDSQLSNQTLTELGLPESHMHEFVFSRNEEESTAIVEVKDM